MARIQHGVMPVALLISLILALGFLNGLRTMTPVAVLAWGAHLHWYSFDHSLFAFLGNSITLWVFTVMALGELVADKLPKTPARTEPVGIAARCVFGAAVGAAVAALAGAALLLGAVLGVVGAVVGTYVGYSLRRALTVSAGLPDLPVALLEDLIAIGGSLFVVSRF